MVDCAIPAKSAALQWSWPQLKTAGVQVEIFKRGFTLVQQPLSYPCFLSVLDGKSPPRPQFMMRPHHLTHPEHSLLGRGPVGAGGWGGSSSGGGRNLPNVPPPPFGWSWLSVLVAAAGTVTVALIGLSQYDYFVVSGRESSV